MPSNLKLRNTLSPEAIAFIGRMAGVADPYRLREDWSLEFTERGAIMESPCGLIYRTVRLSDS